MLFDYFKIKGISLGHKNLIHSPLCCKATVGYKPTMQTHGLHCQHSWNWLFVLDAFRILPFLSRLPSSIKKLGQIFCANRPDSHRHAENRERELV